MTIRKWDAEIRAWLDGAELEWFSEFQNKWCMGNDFNPISRRDLRWRVKMSDEDEANVIKLAVNSLPMRHSGRFKDAVNPVLIGGFE